MKKIIPLVLFCTGVSFANNYQVIIGKESKYEVKVFYNDTKTETDWSNVGVPVCNQNVLENELYYGKTASQTQTCEQNQEKRITTTREYSDGRTEIISDEIQTQVVSNTTTKTITGTHTENSCYNILVNNWGSSSGVYRLSSGINVYCDQVNDGGGWTLVFNHDKSSGYFTSKAQALNVNEGSPSLNTTKYSILNRLNDYKRNNKFEFKLGWKGYSKKQIWRQTSNPTTSAVSGYEAISISSTSNYWGGLEYGYSTNNGSSLLDGSVNHSNWFYAVGSFVSWNNGIPAADSIAGSSNGVANVNLWIR